MNEKPPEMFIREFKPSWEDLRDSHRQREQALIRENFLREQAEQFRRSGSWEQEIKQDPHRRVEKPSYSQTPLKIPSQICVHFVGGPRNCEQQFHPFLLANKWLQVGFFDTIIEGKVDPNDLSQSYLQTSRYNLVPIPQTETPWAEDILMVIAVYKE
jgi:hypothetical protein